MNITTIHVTYYSKIFIDKACDLICYGLSNNGTLDIIVVQDMQNPKGGVLKFIAWGVMLDFTIFDVWLTYGIFSM